MVRYKSFFSFYASSKMMKLISVGTSQTSQLGDMMLMLMFAFFKKHNIFFLIFSLTVLETIFCTKIRYTLCGTSNKFKKKQDAEWGGLS